MGRTTATILFTDLVGSTELRGRLGEEPAEGLRRTHDRLLAQGVETNGGRVVKGLGDGIMATFAGASDAVAAAVVIQQAIDRLNRSGKTSVALAVRVGLSAGDVTFEDDDVHGTPVIEASRLCAAADGGEILAADVVRVLAGSTEGLAWTSFGALELKGLDHPVVAVKVAWEPAVVSSIPMPPLLTDVGRIFVGRDGELERLQQLWKEVAAGERRMALLAGEPGVGKTRLAAELALHLHSGGATVLAGRCDEDLGVPYQPFVEALRHFVDHTAAANLLGSLGRFAGELVRLVPELVDREPAMPPPLASDPETERYRLFDAVAAWLGTLTAEQPTLVVVDDLQWAAKPTLLLMRHILRSPMVGHLLVIGTYRDTDVGYGHPLAEIMADFRREDGVQRISMRGLDSSAVSAYMQEAAGRELEDEDLELARAVYEETEGNPFFVREVFRHLTETGAIAQTEGRWEARGALEDLGIPESVRDVVGRRLSRLSDAANEALRVACVIGAEFDLAVLRTVVGGDEDTVLAAIEEAARARLVIEATGKVNRYRFGHALVRDTLYRELSASRRAAAHRRVAQAVETVHAGALDDHLPALALHWERASTPAVENDKAIDYAIRAGDRALAQLAHDEAASFYAHARELLDASRSGTDDQRRVGLLISLGEAQRRAGDPAHRDTLLEAARLAGDQGDGSALARAALANNRGVHSVAEVVDRERVAALEAALAAIGPQATPTRARLLGTLATELGFAPDHDYRFRLADEALAVARQVGDDPTLAQILSSHVISTFVPTRRAQRIEHAAELTALADRLPDPVPKFWAAFWGGIVAVEGHDIERLERQMRTALRIAAELGQPVLRWLASWSETLWCRTTGRLAQGEVVARDGYETARAAGVPDAYRSYGAILFWIRFDQGRLSELLDVLESATNRPTPSPVSQAAYALALCETDRPDVARPILERLAVNDFAALGYNAMWLYGMTMVAQVAATVDDQATARILYDQLSPFGDLVTTVGALTSGSVHHYLGCLARTLGQHDVADTHFGRATETHRQLSAPVLLTHSRLEWARMLMTRRQAGDTERARELVDQALHTARELGLRGVERHGIALKGEPW